MLFHRTRSLLVLLAVFFAAGITRGQDAQQFDGPDKVFQPFGPTDLGTLTDLQFFAPPELHPLDGWIKPNYGPYFSYERIFWSLHQPDHALIGNPAAVDPVSGELLSDSDNSFIHSVFVWGNRYELGYVDCDGYGWETSILKTNTQYNFERDGLTHIGVIDLGSGGVAAQLIVGGSMAFDYINATRMAGVELMKTYRYPQNQENGSNWEIGFGVRFLQIHDRFDAEEETPPLPLVPQVFFDCAIDNNIVGPQVQLRWFRQREHWILSSEFRFMAGANFENAHSTGSTVNIGSPLLQEGTNSWQNNLNNIEFAPTGEFRLDAAYQLTRSVAVKVGYTGLVTTGIGRASERIDYVLHDFSALLGRGKDFGIINGAKSEHFFANGVNFGIEINR